MKVYFLLIIISLTGHDPAFVFTQAVNMDKGYRPVRTMAKCLEIANAMQQRLSTVMLNSGEVFDGEPVVMCRELDPPCRLNKRHKYKKH